MSSHPLSNFGSSGPCRVCSSPGRCCSRCRTDFYCGKQHQKEDWARHRAGCGSVERRGDRLVAVRDIPAGTVLIKEAPALEFPNSFTEQVLCAGCCAVLAGPRVQQCARCGLAVCGEACGLAAAHQPECGVFQRAGFVIQRGMLEPFALCLNLAVATLRVALMAQEDPRLLELKCAFTPEQMAAVQSSPSADGEISRRRMVHGVVVEFLRETVGADWLTEEELDRAVLTVHLNQVDRERDLGALPAAAAAPVNAARAMGLPGVLAYEAVRDLEKEIILASDRDKECKWGLIYLGMSQLEHSCTPNTAPMPWSGEDSHDHVVVAARDIAAGENISISLENVCWYNCTAERRDTLLSGWGLVCRCKRCQDPTELGLYMGSPCCPSCAGAGAMHFLTQSAEGAWRCGDCDRQMSDDDARALTAAAAERYDALEASGAGEEQWHRFIEQQSFPRGPLHPTHHLVVKAKARLNQDVHMRRAEYFSSECKLSRWERVCRDLLDVLDVAWPGLSVPRVKIIMQQRRLLQARLETAHKTFNLSNISDIHDQLRAVNKEMCKHIYNNEEMLKEYSDI